MKSYPPLCHLWEIVHVMYPYLKYLLAFWKWAFTPWPNEKYLIWKSGCSLALILINICHFLLLQEVSSLSFLFLESHKHKNVTSQMSRYFVSQAWDKREIK